MERDSNVKSIKGQESQDAVKSDSCISLEVSFRGKKSKHVFNKRQETVEPAVLEGEKRRQVPQNLNEFTDHGSIMCGCGEIMVSRVYI